MYHHNQDQKLPHIFCLGINSMKGISMHASLAELGMDSMMAVEIQQSLEREYCVTLSLQDIRSLTFEK